MNIPDHVGRERTVKTPEQIAAEKVSRLTKKQRQAILDGFAWSGHTRLALWKLRITTGQNEYPKREFSYSSIQYHFELNATGLSVRAILQEQADG